jgi:hypothetical protein
MLDIAIDFARSVGYSRMSLIVQIHYVQQEHYIERRVLSIFLNTMITTEPMYLWKENYHLFVSILLTSNIILLIIHMRHLTLRYMLQYNI